MGNRNECWKTPKDARILTYYAVFKTQENQRFSASLYTKYSDQILLEIKSLRLIYTASKIILRLCEFQQENRQNP